MKRNYLFYLLAIFIAYLTGLISYSLTLWAIYDEPLELKVSIWTMMIFLFIGGIWYTLIVLFLKLINRYHFLLQTLLFIVAGMILVSFIPLINGFGNYKIISFLISSEGLLYTVSIFCISIVSSYGIWIGQNNLSKKLFLSFSAIVLLFAIKLG